MKQNYKSNNSFAARTTLYSMLVLLATTFGCKKDGSTAIISDAEKSADDTKVTETVGPMQIDLGSAANFTILAKAGITTTGKTAIVGDIGVSPIAATSMTGFGLIMDASNQFSLTPIVTGQVYAADYAVPTPTKMTVAISDMETAFTVANGLTVPTPIVELHNGNISGRTLAPGIYKWSTSVLVSKVLTLKGGPNDKWVFQIANDLTLSSAARIKLEGGALAKNVTWVVSGQATLGTTSHLCGTILSKTLISLKTGSSVTGKLLAQTAVTLEASKVNKPR